MSFGMQCVFLLPQRHRGSSDISFSFSIMYPSSHEHVNFSRNAGRFPTVVDRVCFSILVDGPSFHQIPCHVIGQGMFAPAAQKKRRKQIE